MNKKKCLVWIQEHSLYYDKIIGMNEVYSAILDNF